jgi:hypothetical protein
MKGAVLMNIDFSEQDVLCIYLEFKKKLKKSTQLKEIQPGNKTAKQDIEIYSSIIDRIEKSYPPISELSNLL